MENITSEVVDIREKDTTSTFDERSDVALEIIARIPSLFEALALPGLLLVLAMLLAATWFVKYPDVVHGTVVMAGSNSPKEIVARFSGNITNLLAANNTWVKQGDMICWIESSADTKEVLSLSHRVDSAIRAMNSGDPKTVSRLFASRFTNLGELQDAYQTFIGDWMEFNDYIVNGFYEAKMVMLEQDLTALKQIGDELRTQSVIKSKDHELAKNTFEMNRKLFEDTVISAEEYRRAMSALLIKESLIPQSAVSMTAQRSQIREKQKEINQLIHDINKQGKIFEQSLFSLKSKIEAWMNQYTVRAPTTGNLVFALPIQQNQYLEQGKLIGYIDPGDSRFYAEIKLSQINFGKLDTGLSVQIRLDAYPHHEVGYLEGVLEYISNVSVDSGFLATARLNNGMMTNQSKALRFRNGLKGEVLIVTKDQRLLQRIYNAILKTTSMTR